MSLLSDRYTRGRRFSPTELIERGDSVAVGLAVTDPGRPEPVEVFKVFTFGGPGGRVVQLRDCPDREGALALLAGTEPL